MCPECLKANFFAVQAHLPGKQGNMPFIRLKYCFYLEIRLILMENEKSFPFHMLTWDCPWQSRFSHPEPDRKYGKNE
jgi:hypothetical protein